MSALSSRRERPPSSRNNLSSRQLDNTNQTTRLIPPLNIKSNNRPASASAISQNNSNNNPSSRSISSRPATASISARSLNNTLTSSSNFNTSVNRPQSSDPVTYYRRNDNQGNDLSYSTNTLDEVLRKIETKRQEETNAFLTSEFNRLGKYNAFSRPKISKVAPLRTVLLDQEVNNFPPSRTRSELLKKIRATFLPHPSFDLDGDGYVSQEDYKTAKRFDLDNNGIIDIEEKQIAQQVLTEEFFQQHNSNSDLPNFSPELALNSHRTNVNKLTNSISFDRDFERLKGLEKSFKAKGSREVSQCLTLSSKALPLTKFNYYTNKFDTTAWNDFDAVPRASIGLDSLPGHGGSRKRLLFVRKQETRERCQDIINISESSKPFIATRRVNLITNP
eukprot:gene18627-24362_t